MPALSGQTTVTTAGTAEPLGSQPIGGKLAVKALSANTGLVFIGNDGSGNVGSADGFQLAAGEIIIFNLVGDLANLMLDAAFDGEGVCWLALE